MTANLIQQKFVNIDMLLSTLEQRVERSVPSCPTIQPETPTNCEQKVIMITTKAFAQFDNFDNFNDTQEIATATLESVEAGFNMFAGGNFEWSRIGILIGLFGVINAGVDNSRDMFRELAIMSDELFDQVFENAASDFDLIDNATEHDVKGIAKGAFHVIRMVSRKKLAKEAA